MRRVGRIGDVGDRVGEAGAAVVLKGTARLVGDHSLINGSQQFISGADYNDIYVCMARTGENRTQPQQK